MSQDEDEPWDEDDPPLEMEHVVSAVELEWNGGRRRHVEETGSVLMHADGPCRCCGVVLGALMDVEPPRHLSSPERAVAKARAFLKAAIWNTQIVRRAVPTRKELVAVISAVERFERLLEGDHEKIANANERDVPYPTDDSPEQHDEWILSGWCPPYGFLSDWIEDDRVNRTRKAAKRFAELATDILEKVDQHIGSLLLDPPPVHGRPRIAFAERYAYRYLAAAGLSASEIEGAVADLVLELRAKEERIGLKSYGKSANPGSLLSTIRRHIADLVEGERQ